jgi:hypothetical protein
MNTLRKLMTFLLSLVLALSFVIPTLAQGTTSRVVGTVTDQNGATIPDAIVILTNEATGASFKTNTTSVGAYVFDSIQVGQYTVSVEKSGFKKFVSPGNNLSIGQPLTVDVSLEVGQVSEAVEVRAVAERVDASSSGNFGTLMENRFVERLPIVGTRGRNPLDLVLLVPGVVSGSNTGGGIHVNGTRDRAWNYTQDGIDTNETSAGGSNLSPTRQNPDMLAEFRVITSNPTAEYGRSSGAQVVMITKSGTNNLHGTLFEFYRTPSFNANEFENNLNKVGKRQFVQHIPGFSLGGPVYIPKLYDGRNKTFFFTNWQWLRTHETGVVTNIAYTELARRGIFRYVKGGQNGNAGTSNPSVDRNGAVLPGVNVGSYDIAANDPLRRGLDTSIQNYLGLTPLPNDFTAGDGLNTAGYTFTALQTERQRDAVFKIDQIINDRHTIFVRYAFGHQNTIGDTVNSGAPPFPGLPPLVATFRSPRNLAANWRWTPSPRLTNEFVFGLNRFTFSFETPDPNANENPPFAFTNVTTPLSNVGPVQNRRRLTTWQFVDNATYVVSAHTFKGGINFRYAQHYDIRTSVAALNTHLNVNFSTTINTVDPATFKLPSDINTSTDRPRLQQAINELLGRVGTMTQAFVAESDDKFAPPGTDFLFDARFGEYDSYVQDTWKLRPNLTIDLGLRWEIRRSPDSKGVPILRPNAPFTVGSDPSNTLKWEEGSLFGDDWNNFAPSIGFAWDPFKDGKTSVRANYRLTYDRLNTFVFSSFIFPNMPGQTIGVTNTTFGQAGGRISDGLPTLAPAAALTPNQLRQPGAFSSNSVTVVDPNLGTPRTHQWGLSLQREVGWKTVVELNYIGNHGSDLFGAYNVNQAEIFSNGFVDAFGIVKAGGESTLMNNLLQADPSRRAGESGSQMVRRLFLSTLNLNSVGALASTLARRTGAGGKPVIELSGFSPFFFFPYPQFAGGMTVLDTNDRSNYHGLQVTARRQFSAGLSFNFGYTFSKSLDTRSFDPTFTSAATANSQSAGSTPFDIRNRDLNYALSDFNRTHVFQGGAVYDLPFGKGRRFGSDVNPAIERVIGGWSVTGGVIWESGRPFTIYSGSNTFGSVVQSFADCSGCTSDMIRRIFDSSVGTEFYFDLATRGPVFNTTTNKRGIFSVPEPGKLGNTGRNFFIAPGFFNANLAIGKSTRITENHRIEYRLEMQNVTNTPSFGLPESATLTSTLFGRARGNTTSGSRKIQMALKYYF